MPGLSPQRRHLRATKARLSQLGADTTTVDADLKAARAEEYVQRLVAEAPPLTPQQRDRLVSLLRPGTVQSGAA